MTEPRTGARLRILALFVVFMFAALTTRLWFLQVLAAEEKRLEAQDNAVRLVEVPAPRGRILDARGKVLVGNRPSLVVTMNREAAGAHKEEVLFRLSRILDVPADELGRRLDDPRYYVFSPVPIATDIPRRTYFYLMEHGDEFPGIEVVKAPVRTYPYGDLAAHALGYLGQISQDELKDPSFAGYRPGDIIGRTGVEAVYEHDLVGTPGVVKYRVNSAGRNLGVIGDQDPVEGNDVRLTIQARIQKLAEDELATGIETARQILDPNTDSYLRANAGAVLVLDPDTGAIEAIASSPTFDPSLFSRSISTEEFDRRFGASTGYPLLNRAIYGEYPPGSTYKPWVALSGLSRGLLTADRYYLCPSSWTVPYDTSDPEAIQYVFNNWTSANLGSMNLAQALVMSCDTVFYPLGYEYWKIYYPPPNDDGIEGNDDLPPKEPFQRDLEAMGFGHVTRVDLTGEQGGRVPDAAWKFGIHEEYPKLFPEGRWVPGDFVNMSIGQGDSLVTPIQMAAAYSALQNGGRMCVPHVLMQVETSDARVVRPMKPKCRKVPFSQSDLTYVRDALTGVPQRGTASGAFVGFPFSQVWVAGKTGTAEVFGRQDYSWFAAMTEAGGERHVIVALVEQGGHGSTTAAPIVRHVIEGIYGLNVTEVGHVQATD